MTDVEQNIEKRLSKIERDLRLRLTRVESKLVRGFEELGVNTAQESRWLEVDDDARVVYLNTLGRSLRVTVQTMLDNGATHHGEAYELVYSDKTIGSIYLLALE